MDAHGEEGAPRHEVEVNFGHPGEPERQRESQEEKWRKKAMTGCVEHLPEIIMPRRGARKNSHNIFRKSFAPKLGLDRQQRIHVGVKSHRCTVCGQCFTRKANLFRHQRLHTGQKSHLCADCGRSFTRRENLIRHMRVHTGERQWQGKNESYLIKKSSQDQFFFPKIDSVVIIKRNTNGLEMFRHEQMLKMTTALSRSYVVDVFISTTHMYILMSERICVCTNPYCMLDL